MEESAMKDHSFMKFYQQQPRADPEPRQLFAVANVYNYVLYFRDGGEMHQRRGIGVLVESVVFTPDKLEAMGIPEGTLPNGWWLGLKITDDEVWSKVKDGTYSMFSIEGEATRQPIEETEEDANEQE